MVDLMYLIQIPVIQMSGRKLTPYKGWVPENCPEIDDEFYFLVKWKDWPGGNGWIADYEGKVLIYPHEGKPYIMNQQLKLF